MKTIKCPICKAFFRDKDYYGCVTEEIVLLFHRGSWRAEPHIWTGWLDRLRCGADPELWRNYEMNK